MNDAKAANRLRLTVLLVLCLGIALASFWLMQVMHKEINEHAPDKTRNDPDYFVENFTFVRLAKTGQARYIVNGTHLTHRPRDDSTEIMQPVVQSLSPERATITVHANRAQIDHDNSRIELTGDVHLERPAQGNAQRFQVRSPSLVLLPDDDIATSKDAVDAEIGTSKMSAVGMEANNATGQLHLLSKTRIKLQTGR